MDRNRIFIDRTRNVGVISPTDAINWGFTGPILRSTGAPRALRKDPPYLPNGELGFYLVSTGEGTPHKVHVRSPSFVHMGGLKRLLEGYQLADIIPTFGSVNMIGGECDR